MSLLALLIGLGLAFVCLWAANKYLPDDPPVRLIANIVIIAVLLVALLAVFGVLPALHDPLPRAR
jgi:hypothetical protein